MCVFLPYRHTTTLAKLQNVLKNHYPYADPCSCGIYILSKAVQLRIIYIWHWIMVYLYLYIDAYINLSYVASPNRDSSLTAQV